MSTEKIIKQQAKESLRSNWISVIAAVVAFCVALIMIEQLFLLVCVQFNIINVETGAVNEISQMLFYLVSALQAVMYLFISPVINGIVKMIYNICSRGESEIYDMFFFFTKAKRYFKTILLNLFFVSVFSVLSFGLDTYGYLSVILDKTVYDGLCFDGISAVLLITYILSLVIKILVYFIFVHYPFIAYSAGYNIPYGKYFFGFISFSIRHFGETIKLFFSFIGWFVLCFFVVPAFYVFPYVATSMINSAKWLFLLEKDRRKVC